MPLPTPNLDDRHFQDIVDQAKTLIPLYCPEWTDHNVSDPGVTLIELFAWMTDMLLYRVNQVPDKIYIKMLDMIGVHLHPPRPARAPITFYLSAAQPNDITIPEGTEVATVQTETNPAIIFTTEADLTIRPPAMTGAFTSTGRGSSMRWTMHDLEHLAGVGRQIAMFPREPVPGDAFYIAFAGNHSHHVLALTMTVEMAGGAGVDPRNPPLQWQVWQGGANRWVPCQLEYDGTGGFNESGDIILHTPAMIQAEFEGLRAHWLRCQLTAAQAGPGGYQVSPDLQRLQVESRGGTTNARHAITIHDEILGNSDGTPGQCFQILHTPILTRDPDRDYLIVQPAGGEPERWKEVEDFADSTATDNHYVLDSLTGTLDLGPSLLQPDGSVYRFGAVPLKGSILRLSRYQHGGGMVGNVTSNALTILKTSIPYINQVTNREAASGGREAQSLEDAKVRAPQSLRTRTRAVTADDYEHLASQVPGVARTACIAPGSQPGAAGAPKPGQVFVVVLPQVDDVNGRIPADRMALSAELRSAVLDTLNKRRLIGTALDVRQPGFIWVSVIAVVRVPERSPDGLKREVQQRADRELYRYLNPYIGGPEGSGWPFGRDLYLSEVYALLQRVPSVDFVESVQISIREAGTSATAPSSPSKLTVPRNAVICSNQHEVTVH